MNLRITSLATSWNNFKLQKILKLKWQNKNRNVYFKKISILCVNWNKIKPKWKLEKLFWQLAKIKSD